MELKKISICPQERGIVKRIFRDTMIVQTLSATMPVISLVVDGAVTGSLLGTTELAAYGLATPLLLTVTALSNAAGNGLSTVLGKDIGKGDIKGAEKHMFSSIAVFTVIFVLAVLLVFLAARPIARLLGASGEMLDLTAQYLRGYAPAIPPLIVIMMLLPVMQIDGNRQHVFKTMAVMTAVNIGSDFLNVYVLRWGLMGMALATTYSHYAALIAALLHFLHPNGMLRIRASSIDFACVRDVIRYGLPGALYMEGRSFLAMFTNWLLLKVAGTSAIAISAAIIATYNFGMCAGNGIGAAVTLLTGMYSGEKDREALQTVVDTGVRYSVAVNTVISVLLIVFSRPIMTLYIHDPSISLETAALCLCILTPAIILDSIHATFRNYFQAMSISVITYPYAILDSFICNAAAAYILGHMFGLYGVWIGMVSGRLVTLLIMMIMIRFRSDRNKHFREAFFMLSQEYYADTPQATFIIHHPHEVQEASGKVQRFMCEHGSLPATALKLSIAVEELANNIVKYGFRDKRRHIIEVRVTAGSGGWILRMADDCGLFDPPGYLKNFHPDDTCLHIGIRMVSSLVDDMQYMSTFKTNNTILKISDRSVRNSY